MIDDLLGVLETMNVQDVRQMSFDEIDDLCKNPVFLLLCDFCQFWLDRKRKVKK